ncbi:MAG TPA: DUF1835 domain-containing protein [Candidatus Gallacutalibacter stercoravium]|nr:DUF1835 domain-containing protein [Candidatus Gallacutalibacter stercoravium]
MVDIVFGENACASLKIAQTYGQGPYPGGCIGVIISHTDGSKPTRAEKKAAQRQAEQKARQAWESAVPLGGKNSDVFGFSLALSVGAIEEVAAGEQRLQALRNLFRCYPGDTGNLAAQELVHRANADLAAVRSRAEEGEDLRIWYSSQPDEMCGLFWLMDKINQWKNFSGRITVVPFPHWLAQEPGDKRLPAGWGDIGPEEWHRYLGLQRFVSPKHVQSCAARWQELKRENAPLRAVINGGLHSVPEDFYDSFILREIDLQENVFQEAALIGNILSKYQLGISDGWVALRVEQMIEEGRLFVAGRKVPQERDSPSYHRLLQKSKAI